MQRVDTGAHRDCGDQIGVGVQQQLGPRALDRERLDLRAVHRQPSVGDDAAIFELPQRRRIRGTVERHRQLEIQRVHAQGRARHRDAFRVTRQLELRRPRVQRVEREVAVAQDPHLAVLDAAVHAPRHLEDLVRPERQPREDVAPAVDHVLVAGVEDDDGVEACDVERRLPRGRHRQQIRLLGRPLEEGPDHADRLAAVIEGGRQRRPLRARPPPPRPPPPRASGRTRRRRGARGRPAAGTVRPGTRGPWPEPRAPVPPAPGRRPSSRVPAGTRGTARRTTGSTVAESQMNRHPARLPRARHNSSSAEVWWISSTTTVSSPVISPAWNHRRAMPVVTITTFQLGVSGVASRSRFTTPTLSGTRRIVSAIGRIPSVLPVPVPATMPKPKPARARAWISSPCSASSTVRSASPSAISMVSHAARVGAITTTRPVAGRAAWKACRSGGR